MGRKPQDIQNLAMELIMADDASLKKEIQKKILGIAYKKGIYLSSIHDLYMARGRGEYDGFTVPAINLRSMTYDLAAALFRLARKNNSGAFIFEM
ncbi:MAG: aldolase, partial [Candidatus Omnitrophica bacterium]|nr:aldolase [Candidatus Omnitrophota bacterium]